MNYFSISGGLKMPALGLGTWKSNSGAAANAVTIALENGYRHIDCAPIYKNEKEIGPAFSSAFRSNIVAREDLWVTSKLWNNAHAPRHVRPALERTLKDLQLDYLDLFLIHWPVSFKQDIEFPRDADGFIAPDDIPIIETWHAMEKMVKKGLCRAIGVCNFNQTRLLNLVQNASIHPTVNQIELHPYLQQQDMLNFCRNNNIQLTAYSPLGSSDRPSALKKNDEPSLLNHPVVLKIAGERGATPAQVLIAWALARNTSVIPKSVSPERIRENFLAQDLQLKTEDLKQLGTLEQGYRYVDGSFFCGPGSPYTLPFLWDNC